ncbi:aspartate racemase [Aminobacter sp. DSM 101952]|uniref:aspartate/glutamate racemase family protein n=1 Tax=Aminobacter sp. DSM 101952 TaxID=2735891 RepID=UPI0006FDB27A|nr:amino acid racemase [Aminobacter sp. DSM 101952]KQU69861.1 aspartate racemase [Aminobacter sp. DSM 101952]
MIVRQTQLIGLIGGMSWESSALYYRLINEAAHRRLGGHHNARSLMFTLDFDELNDLAAGGEWERVAEVIITAARHIEAGGAAFAMLTAVTAHYVADKVAAAIRIPLLHIADPAGRTLQAAGHKRVGLLGTRYTMELGFFGERLERQFGIEVLVPPEDERTALHRIIIDELTLGVAKPESRAVLLHLAKGLQARGAGAVVSACTELPLLLAMEDYPVPAYDVVKLHAEAAVDLALGDGSSPSHEDRG